MHDAAAVAPGSWTRDFDDNSQPSRPVAHTNDVHVGQADEQCAHPRSIRFQAGAPRDSMTSTSPRIAGPLRRARDLPDQPVPTLRHGAPQNGTLRRGQSRRESRSHHPVLQPSTLLRLRPLTNAQQSRHNLARKLIAARTTPGRWIRIVNRIDAARCSSVAPDPISVGAAYHSSSPSSDSMPSRCSACLVLLGHRTVLLILCSRRCQILQSATSGDLRSRRPTSWCSWFSLRQRASVTLAGVCACAGAMATGRAATGSTRQAAGAVIIAASAQLGQQWTGGRRRGADLVWRSRHAVGDDLIREVRTAEPSTNNTDPRIAEAVLLIRITCSARDGYAGWSADAVPCFGAGSYGVMQSKAQEPISDSESIRRVVARHLRDSQLPSTVSSGVSSTNVWGIGESIGGVNRSANWASVFREVLEELARSTGVTNRYYVNVGSTHMSASGGPDARNLGTRIRPGTRSGTCRGEAGR